MRRLALSQAADADAGIQRFMAFLARRRSNTAEEHLCTQAPVGGDIPGFRDFSINQRVVVLDIHADTGSGEKGGLFHWF